MSSGLDTMPAASDSSRASVANPAPTSWRSVFPHSAAWRTGVRRPRLRIEQAARSGGPRLNVASLSTRTIVYKALVTPEALPRFCPDLSDARFCSAFVTFHQRFSTNTSADWALAQPFRTLAHNGE